MSDSTEIALAAVLKEKMKTKPLNKITVTELAEAVGINRQTFYYHFKDVENLTWWFFKNSLSRVFNSPDMTTSADLADSLLRVFNFAQSNKDIILNAVSSDNHDMFEHYLKAAIATLLLEVIKKREAALNISLTSEDENDLLDYFTYPFSYEATVWIRKGLTYDVSPKIRKMTRLFEGDIDINLKILNSYEKEKGETANENKQ